MSKHPTQLKDISRRRFLRKAGTSALTAGAAVSAISAGAGEFQRIPEYAPPPSGKKLRIGVVGGGFGAAFPWHDHPDCEVTAVADLREDRRRRLMEHFRCPNSYGDFRPDMLRDPKVDAIAIFTGAPEHASHCIDVLKAGKHTICAVPAALTLEDCHALVETVKRTGLIYMMAETSCFHAPTMLARRWREEGRFGRIYFTEGDYIHNHGSYLINDTLPPQSMEMFVYQGKPTWRYGNSPGLYVTHATGPVIYVTGEKLTEVVAVGTPIDHPFYKENQYDNPYINMTFFHKTSGGNSSRIAVHWWTATRGREGADYHGTELSFFQPKMGRQSYVSSPSQEAEPFEVDDHSSLLPPNMRPRVKEGHAGAEVFIVNEFVSACLQERSPAVDVYHSVAYTAPGLCGIESVRRDGEWVKVPDFGPIS